MKLFCFLFFGVRKLFWNGKRWRKEINHFWFGIFVSLSTCFFFFFFFSSNLHRDVGKEIIFYSISVLFFTGCYLYCGSRSGGLAPYSRFAGRLTAWITLASSPNTIKAVGMEWGKLLLFLIGSHCHGRRVISTRREREKKVLFCYF